MVASGRTPESAGSSPHIGCPHGGRSGCGWSLGALALMRALAGEAPWGSEVLTGDRQGALCPARLAGQACYPPAAPGDGSFPSLAPKGAALMLGTGRQRL